MLVLPTGEDSRRIDTDLLRVLYDTNLSAPNGIWTPEVFITMLVSY